MPKAGSDITSVILPMRRTVAENGPYLWAVREEERARIPSPAVVHEMKNTHWYYPLKMMFDSENLPDWFGLPNMASLEATFSIESIRSWAGQKIAEQTKTASRPIRQPRPMQRPKCEERFPHP